MFWWARNYEKTHWLIFTVLVCFLILGFCVGLRVVATFRPSSLACRFPHSSIVLVVDYQASPSHATSGKITTALITTTCGMRSTRKSKFKLVLQFLLKGGLVLVASLVLGSTPTIVMLSLLACRYYNRRVSHKCNSMLARLFNLYLYIELVLIQYFCCMNEACCLEY